MSVHASKPYSESVVFEFEKFKANTDAPVILFYPHTERPEDRSTKSQRKGYLFTDSYKCRAPLAVMALAGVLKRYGYNVNIIDARMHDDYLEQVLSAANSAICLGISAIVGYQIKDGVHVATEVKKRFPGLPIIWGGWHPTMAVEQTICDSRVDIVVKGQGDITFLEIVWRISNKLSLEDVLGVTYKQNGKIIHNPNRPAIDPNLLPPLPYDLINVEQYLASSFEDERAISYFTSYGCPNHCTFCSNVDVFGTRWYALKPERVVDDLEMLVKKYGAKHIILDDSNYFASKRRALDIAKLVIKRGLGGRFIWDATGDARVLSTFSVEEFILLKKSGCAVVFIGAETGDPVLMKIFGKHITEDQVINSVAGLGKANIIPIVSFIVGVPDEPEDSLDKTLRLASDLFRVHSRPEVHLFFFNPIPHTTLSKSKQVSEAFTRPPRDLEGWARHFDFSGYVKTKFEIPEGYQKRIRRFRDYATLMNVVFPYRNENSLSYKLIRKIALFRLRRLWFRFPIELLAFKFQLLLKRKIASFG